MEKERGKERTNGKVWGGIGVSFGKDWVDGRLWVRLGGSGRWVGTRFGGEMGVMEDAPEGSV